MKKARVMYMLLKVRMVKYLLGLDLEITRENRMPGNSFGP